MQDPDKAHPIGTNRLKEAMSEAFAMGAVNGDRGDNGALGHEIDTAVRASGSSELKAVANAIDRDDGATRGAILDRIFHDKVTPHGGPIDRVREIQVSGRKFESALTDAYAEGVKASEAIKDFVRAHPGESSVPDVVSYFGRGRMKKSIEIEVVEKYDPDQSRDDRGRFGSGGGGAGPRKGGGAEGKPQKSASAMEKLKGTERYLSINGKPDTEPVVTSPHEVYEALKETASIAQTDIDAAGYRGERGSSDFNLVDNEVRQRFGVPGFGPNAAQDLKTTVGTIRDAMDSVYGKLLIQASMRDSDIRIDEDEDAEQTDRLRGRWRPQMKSIEVEVVNKTDRNGSE